MPGTTRLAFVDLETTGLFPHLGHEPWDIAVIWRDLRPDGTPVGGDQEANWIIQPDLRRADPNALRIGRYYERTAAMKPGHFADPRVTATKLAYLLDGAIIIGAVPSFDTGHLAVWLRDNGQCLSNHYHVQDVETLALGYLWGGNDGVTVHPTPIPRWPLDSEALSRAIGVDPGLFERHTALGDARWAKAMFDTVTLQTHTLGL